MFAVPPKFQVNFNKSSGPWQKLLSPNDHKVLTEIQYATGSDVEFLLSRLGHAQRTMNKLKAHERATILRKVAERIKKD